MKVSVLMHWFPCVQVKAVADAAVATRKAFVGQLNPQGIKVAMPDFLAALDTKKNWQTKTAALASLGELTKRCPEQTSKCLPDIIPAISAVMGDAKPQVKVCEYALVSPVSSLYSKHWPYVIDSLLRDVLRVCSKNRL